MHTRIEDCIEILKKEDFNENSRKYYEEHYGKGDTDVWYVQPAVNVWAFGRDGKFITLKSHILTGDVEEYIEISQQCENERK